MEPALTNAAMVVRRGHVERIDYHDDSFETQQHDPNGNLIARTDRSGRTTQFAYDAANRLVATTDALGGITTSTWDAAGNLVAELDANGHQTT